MFIDLINQRTGCKEFVRADSVNHVTEAEAGAVVHCLSGGLAVTLAVKETPREVVERIEHALAKAVQFPR